MSNWTPRFKRFREWWPVLLLVFAVLFAVGGLLWFLKQAVDNERLVSHQKLVSAYEGYLQAGQSRLEIAWAEDERVIAESLTGLSPTEAFAFVARNNLASSALIIDGNGQMRYPTISAKTSDLPDNSAEIKLLAETVRGLVEDEHYQAAAEAIDALVSDKSLSHVTDGHGRVIALNTAWFLLESWKDTEHPAFGKVATALNNLLNDYGHGTPPASQRRFLMKAMKSKIPPLEFSTLDAEDIAARVLLKESGPLAYDSGLQQSRAKGIWVYASSQGSCLRLFTEEALKEKMQRLLEPMELPHGCRFVLSSRSDAALELSRPLGRTFQGWSLGFAVPSDAIASITNKRITRYTSIGLGIIAILGLLTWFVAKSVLATTRRAQLKENLAATISHELKTPLASMRLLVDVLLEDDAADQIKTREYLQLVAKENLRLSHLVENFLTFSRLERNASLGNNLIDSHELLNESAATAIQQFAGERLKLEAESPIKAIRGDRAAVMTVLMNLIDNACKYSPHDKLVTLRGFDVKDEVCFEVEDGGKRLNTKQESRAFQMFERLDQEESRIPGCGLGLHIVQTIVQKLGGRVEVHPATDSGNCFRVLIPAAKP